MGAVARQPLLPDRATHPDLTTHGQGRAGLRPAPRPASESSPGPPRLATPGRPDNPDPIKATPLRGRLRRALTTPRTPGRANACPAEESHQHRPPLDKTLRLVQQGAPPLPQEQNRAPRWAGRRTYGAGFRTAASRGSGPATENTRTTSHAAETTRCIAPAQGLATSRRSIALRRRCSIRVAQVMRRSDRDLPAPCSVN